MRKLLVSIILCLLLTTTGFANGFAEIQSQNQLAELTKKYSPAAFNFVKDKPIAGYVITSAKFAKLPPVIQKYLGKTDATSYTEAYLEANLGTIVALQMNGSEPDFYIIGKDTFNQKYKLVYIEDVIKKNEKLWIALNSVEEIKALLNSKNGNLVGALKTLPVKMIRMSDIGYPINVEITIQSPWGGQTKPANQDAYLAFDDTKQQYYMVNVDANGLPISYIPTR